MEKLEMFARYIWPLILVWNVYLFQGQQNQAIEFQHYKLYVAQNYTSKADLKNMFDEQKVWFNEKLDLTLDVIHKKQ